MHKTRKDLIEFLNVALVAAGHTMRSASLSMGLNHAYLSQFMKQDGYSPEVLPEDVRKALAVLLNTSEENLRVSSSGLPFVKSIEGNSPQTGNHTGRAGLEARAVSDRRNLDMRIDHLYEELGRLKERVDRLEAERAANGHRKGRNTTRP